MSGFPVTINGNTYTQADFSQWGYFTKFPAILNDLAAVAAGIAAAAAAGALFVTAVSISVANANALAVGPAGSTNPTLQIDSSTASAATGLKIKSAAAAAGVALSVISSGTNENLSIDAKGSGTVTIGGVSTGGITLSRATTISANLSLSNTVASNARSLVYQTSGSTRWQVGPDFTAEGGANAGSLYTIQRFSDAGSFLGTPLSINRATGNIAIESALTISSGTASVSTASGALTAVGGAGFGGALWVGGLANIAGALSAGGIIQTGTSFNVGTLSLGTTAGNSVQSFNVSTTDTNVTQLILRNLRTANGSTHATDEQQLYRLVDGAAVMGYVAWGSNYVSLGLNGAENARLDSNGYWLVGYTTSNGAYKLQVNSQIYATSATVATSDLTLKNVRSVLGDFDGAQQMSADFLADCLAVPLIGYDRKDRPQDKLRFGYGAQHWESVLRKHGYVDAVGNGCGGVVTHLENGTIGLDEGAAHALKIAALTAELSAAKSRIAALEFRAH